MLTTIPTALAVSGQGLPNICARHGKPAAVRYRFDVSTPIGAEYLLLFFGVVPFLIYRMVTRKTATVGPWPLCADCLSRRRKILILGIGAGVLSIVTAVAGVVVFGRPTPLLLGIVLLAVTTALTLKYVSWANLAQATITENQQFVQVYAVRDFAVAVKSAPAAAAQLPPPPQRMPLPWFRPLKPMWIIALALGAIGLAGGGVQLISGGPMCGSETMSEGDVCVTEHYNRADDVSSYEKEAGFMYFFTIAGGLLAIAGGAGIAANKAGNKRRYLAFTAAQNG